MGNTESTPENRAQVQACLAGIVQEQDAPAGLSALQRLTWGVYDLQHCLAGVLEEKVAEAIKIPVRFSMSAGSLEGDRGRMMRGHYGYLYVHASDVGETVSRGDEDNWIELTHAEPAMLDRALVDPASRQDLTALIQEMAGLQSYDEVDPDLEHPCVYYPKNWTGNRHE